MARSVSGVLVLTPQIWGMPTYITSLISARHAARRREGQRFAGAGKLPASNSIRKHTVTRTTFISLNASPILLQQHRRPKHSERRAALPAPTMRDLPPLIDGSLRVRALTLSMMPRHAFRKEG